MSGQAILSALGLMALSSPLWDGYRRNPGYRSIGNCPTCGNRRPPIASRRIRGDGALCWHEGRERWIASITTGIRTNGKRITKPASGRTKAAARDKLKKIIRDHDDGLTTNGHGYTVGQAVTLCGACSGQRRG